jgi:hypothetical protein
MALDPATLPKDVAALTALLIAAEARADQASAARWLSMVKSRI